MTPDGFHLLDQDNRLRTSSYRICFLIPYYGALPPYLDLFLQSCRKNEDYLFCFVTDLALPADLPPNVRLMKLSLRELSRLILAKTGVEPDIRAPYKLCDFKPAYGLIFEDHIRTFSHWGHLDIDLILGNISEFITSELLQAYDIISARKEWISGAFTVYRNTAEICHLFQHSPDWSTVLSDHRNFIFDEASRLPRSDPLGVYQRLAKGQSIATLETEVVSFTHVVKHRQQCNGLRAFFSTFAKESIAKSMLLHYSPNGVAVQFPGKSDFKPGSEWLFYHFITEKQKPYFRYPRWKKIPEEYWIDEYGFYNRRELLLRRTRAVRARAEQLLNRALDKFRRIAYSRMTDTFSQK
ncbi:hypothetical protein dqs_3396 [Azoarcus olearius]|uniref:DUF6625 family protein n=1 Tax=Azoarcus sp. (strain BH72) TaxID=418699 RepID=UPI0008060AC3|nr:DUF6625 family protein [Azoarcus olearius]ANQ86417.1 hypothetical protein dqs_3396 [Azoarcus olearius]